MHWTTIWTAIKDILLPLLAGGVITLILTKQYERKGQKRQLFAEAYQAVLSWQEMLYRVRRRASGDEAERELINEFHNLQEKLNYFQGIISSESKSLGKSYKKFVQEVKSKNQQLIQKAWESKTRKPSDGTPKNEEHPDINTISENFMNDVREWLVWWQLPKICVWKRNK